MFDIALLCGFVAAREQQINHLCTPGEISPVTWPNVNAHFRYAFANWPTVTEIAMLCRADSVKYPGSPNFVLQTCKPSVKFRAALKSVHE